MRHALICLLRKIPNINSAPPQKKNILCFLFLFDVVAVFWGFFFVVFVFVSGVVVVVIVIVVVIIGAW